MRGRGRGQARWRARADEVRCATRALGREGLLKQVVEGVGACGRWAGVRRRRLEEGGRREEVARIATVSARRGKGRRAPSSTAGYLGVSKLAIYRSGYLY